jgi:hypothetical protein
MKRTLMLVGVVAVVLAGTPAAQAAPAGSPFYAAWSNFIATKLAAVRFLAEFGVSPRVFRASRPPASR